jgi:hypothetical protein
MMTLISLGIVVAFVASVAATLGFFAIDVWWEVATLITIMLLGHWLEMKAVVQARGALDALAALLPDSAERITESGIEKVPVAELQVGGVVLVRPGARVPADAPKKNPCGAPFNTPHGFVFLFVVVTGARVPLLLESGESESLQKLFANI